MGRAILSYIPVIALAGCVQGDLGSAPFLCNNGLPECPDGYSCQAVAGQKMCIKDGVQISSADLTSRPDTHDLTIIQLDRGPLPDRSQTPDRSRVDQVIHKWDGTPDGTPLDMSQGPDGGDPPLLCQSNSECTDPDNRCCCLLLIFKTCMPVCFDPLCLSI